VDEDAIAVQLREREGELAREFARLTAPPDEATAIGFGKRIGDGTTEAVERLSTTAAAKSLDASLREVRRALAKLDEGSYGTCDDCGGPIPAERLEARPATARCVACRGSV
jgi:DnaK suppressor protein